MSPVPVPFGWGVGKTDEVLTSVASCKLGVVWAADD